MKHILSTIWIFPQMAILYCYWRYVPSEWEGHKILAGLFIAAIVATFVAVIEERTRP